MIDQVSPEGGAAADLKKSSRKRLSMADPTKIGRLPPHSLEAEQGVLGCILQSPKDCMSDCVEKFKAGAEVFYDQRHQAIFTAMAEMSEIGDPVDEITLQQKLRSKQQLDAVGGLAYISSLPDAIPSAANLSYYAEIVWEKYLLRRMIQTCTDAVSRAYEPDADADTVIDEAERDIFSIRTGDTKTMPTHKLVQEAMDGIEQMFDRKGKITGISTGLIDLDKMTDGLHPGEMVIIAAYPSGGKTALAMNIAEHAALVDKIPVGVFTLEMTGAALVQRILCANAKINLRAVRDGFLTERDLPRLAVSAGKVAHSCIYFDDTNDLTVNQLRAKARRMVQQFGIKLFVIDYMQLLSGAKEGKKTENRQQEVADISRGIKSMAKELKVAVIALSQLNDDGKLRESRAIGQDADGIFMLEKPETKGNEDHDAYPVDLWIRKQRNGPRNVKVPLTFLAEFTRFESASKINP